jgi:hypothetical protein
MDVSLWGDDDQSGLGGVSPYREFELLSSIKDGQQFRDFSAKLASMIPEFPSYGTMPGGDVISYGERTAAGFRSAVEKITRDVLVFGLKEPEDAAKELAHTEVSFEYGFADTAPYRHVKSSVLRARYMDALSGCTYAKAKSIRSDMDALRRMGPSDKPADFCLYSGIAGSLMSDRMDTPSLYGDSANLEPYTIVRLPHLTKMAGEN